MGIQRELQKHKHKEAAQLVKHRHQNCKERRELCSYERLKSLWKTYWQTKLTSSKQSMSKALAGELKVTKLVNVPAMTSITPCFRLNDTAKATWLPGVHNGSCRSRWRIGTHVEA